MGTGYKTRGPLVQADNARNDFATQDLGRRQDVDGVRKSSIIKRSLAVCMQEYVSLITQADLVLAALGAFFFGAPLSALACPAPFKHRWAMVPFHESSIGFIHSHLFASSAASPWLACFVRSDRSPLAMYFFCWTSINEQYCRNDRIPQ